MIEYSVNSNVNGYLTSFMDVNPQFTVVKYGTRNFGPQVTLHHVVPFGSPDEARSQALDLSRSNDSASPRRTSRQDVSSAKSTKIIKIRKNIGSGSHKYHNDILHNITSYYMSYSIQISTASVISFYMVYPIAPREVHGMMPYITSPKLTLCHRIHVEKNAIKLAQAVHFRWRHRILLWTILEDIRVSLPYI